MTPDQITLALYTCRTCGVELEYQGVGRPPAYCQAHRPASFPPLKGRPATPQQLNGGRSRGPLARAGDAETSKLAATRNADSAEKVEARIRASFAAHGPLTDDQLCAVTEGLPATIKTARSRMKNRGEIVKTGLKRPSNTGSPMIVWRLA